MNVGGQPVLHSHVPAAQTLLGCRCQLTAINVQVVDGLKVIVHPIFLRSETQKWNGMLGIKKITHTHNILTKNYTLNKGL